MGGGRVSGMDQNIFFTMIQQIYFFSSCLGIKLFTSLSLWNFFDYILKAIIYFNSWQLQIIYLPSSCLKLLIKKISLPFPPEMRCWPPNKLWSLHVINECIKVNIKNLVEPTEGLSIFWQRILSCLFELECRCFKSVESNIDYRLGYIKDLTVFGYIQYLSYLARPSESKRAPPSE